MKTTLSHIKLENQYLICVVSVGMITSLCLFTREFLDHKVVAYILLMVVSLLAMFLDILPVLLSAVLSALILNFSLYNLIILFIFIVPKTPYCCFCFL